ncbi:MAG: hypothetical protein WCG25_02085 [bacterium]
MITVVFIAALHSLNLSTSCFIISDILDIAQVDQVETFTTILFQLLDEIVIV